MTDKQKSNLYLFFAVIAVANIAIGFSDGLFNNYFNDVYHMTGTERGLIEFPRELPGVIVFLLISLFTHFGDITIAVIAQGLSALGLAVLGFFTPALSVMLMFLFTSSLGFHIFMPLRDSICMSLSEPDKIGKRMGQYTGIQFGVLMACGAILFFLFHFGVFSFTTATKWPFVIAAFFYMAAMVLTIKLKRNVGQVKSRRQKIKFVFRRQYKYYYLLAVVFGVQKQVMLVFGPWVLIKTLGQQTDVIVLLGMIASLLGMFFMPQLGKWIDKFGVKKLLYADAFSFIFVYLCYGLLAQFFNGGVLATVGLPVILACTLFVTDRLSSQMGIIRTVYLKSIAVKESDVTPTLSFAMMLDHAVSIVIAVLGGLLWDSIGSHYIFYIVAALSFVNLGVAVVVKEPKKAALCEVKAPVGEAETL